MEKKLTLLTVVVGGSLRNERSNDDAIDKMAKTQLSFYICPSISPIRPRMRYTMMKLFPY